MAAERLPSLHSGIKTTVAPGDPLARSMGHYGKGADPIGAMATQNAGLPPVINEKAPGSIRDPMGGIKTHPKQGDVGPGMLDGYGTGDGRTYGSSGDNT